MGLFNKLKNALFEEEEIEIPLKETPEVKPIKITREEVVEKKSEIEKKNLETVSSENEKNLFKVENTFKFPEFDEEEFKTSYKPPIEKEEKKEPVITPKENFDRVKPITFDYDKKIKLSRKENTKKENKEENQKKTFKPSPVISPVYGVLDKNYKKEDIITVKEEKPKKVYDVDAIRRKAFGTLEEDIERSFETPKENFFGKTDQNIDELLSESANEQIDISYETRSNSRESRNAKPMRTRVEEIDTTRRSSRHFEEEQEEEEYRIEPEVNHVEDLQVLDKESSKSEKEHFEEDTLENDLFDLIDSMYDNREEEEE